MRGRKGLAIGLGASLALAGFLPALSGRVVAPTSGAATVRTLARVEQRDALAARVAIIGLDGADWSVIDPLEEAWAGTKPETYRAGEWGPRAADELLARTGRAWRRA